MALIIHDRETPGPAILQQTLNTCRKNERFIATRMRGKAQRGGRR